VARVTQELHHARAENTRLQQEVSDLRAKLEVVPPSTQSESPVVASFADHSPANVPVLASTRNARDAADEAEVCVAAADAPGQEVLVAEAQTPSRTAPALDRRTQESVEAGASAREGSLPTPTAAASVSLGPTTVEDGGGSGGDDCTYAGLKRGFLVTTGDTTKATNAEPAAVPAIQSDFVPAPVPPSASEYSYSVAGGQHAKEELGSCMLCLEALPNDPKEVVNLCSADPRCLCLLHRRCFLNPQYEMSDQLRRCMICKALADPALVRQAVRARERPKESAPSTWVPIWQPLH